MPVVTVKKDGVLDTVRNNRTGFLFNNDREFVRKIVELLQDDTLVTKMGI